MAEKKEKAVKKMTLGCAAIGFALPIVLMIVLILVGVDLTVAILAAVFALLIYGAVMGISWQRMEASMNEGIHSIAGAAVIMLLVGGMVGVWMASGSVPSMLYYGLKLVNPGWFLPIAFLLTMFTALCTGTSWGAVGTIGVVLIGMSAGLGIPVAYTAGAIVSGAQMGDKMSPLSDTTLLAAASAECTVFEHVTSMFYTTIPAALICIVIYTFLGLSATGNIDYTAVNALTDGLQAGFRINVGALIPVVLVLVLSVLRVPAFVTFGAGIAAGGVWAMLFQHESFSAVMGYILNGFTSATGNASLDGLLSRGGMNGMLGMVAMILMCGMLSGLLTEMKCLTVLVDALKKRVHSVGGIITAILLSAFALAISTGGQYPPLTIPAVAFKDACDEMDIHRSVLSRSMEDVGTLLCAIMPWGIATAFYSSSLGVAPLDYIPFTFLPMLSIVFAFINAWVGFGVFRKNDTIKYRPFWRRPKSTNA